ncbi:MAG: helix-turn-helix transcriptional regulator [Acidobacteriota bacterium]|nr:PadR family transcriptional regulator [Candidatus Aminicenantes bacterium]
MNLLSRAEEIILLAVFKLKKNAYGISIRELIKKETGVEWSFAQIYDPLNRLFQKGYVSKSKGGSEPERGGRPKCLYVITRSGKAALLEIRAVQDSIWNSVSKNTLS